MCGKFTGMASYREVFDFSQPLTNEGGGGGGDEGAADEVVTYRVGSQLPVIIWDAEAGKRRIVPMRWGFPDPRDWRRPRPIHARAETVDIKEPFRTPFHAGQRGVVAMRTFNEGKEVVKPSGATETQQWTIDPQDGQPRGFAFVWRRYELPDMPVPMLFCVLVTVPANELIRREIMPGDSDPRMPAILEDFSVWKPGSARTAPSPRRPRRCSRRWKA